MQAPETSPTYPVPTIATRIVSAPHVVFAADDRSDTSSAMTGHDQM
jgi:hypothetical protein